MREGIRSSEAHQLESPPGADRSRKPPTDGRDAIVYSFITGKKMSDEEIAAHKQEITKARASAISKAGEVADTDVTIMKKRLVEDEINNREILRCIDAFRSNPSNAGEEDVVKIISALVGLDLVDFSPDDYKSANDSRRLLGLRKSPRQSMRDVVARNLAQLEHLLEI
jgi:hypothetical protein